MQTPVVTETAVASAPASPPKPDAAPANAVETTSPEPSAPAESPEVASQTPVESEAPAEPTSPEASPVETVTADDLNARSLKQATAKRAAALAQADTVAQPVDRTTPIASSGIVIRASDSSWVEVRDPANGRVIFTGLLSPEATIDVPDISGLLLDTGNAGALEIYVDGAMVPKLGSIGSVRKGVSLNADRLKAGTAVNR